MSIIRGTIVNVKDFLSQKKVEIKITGTSEGSFELEEGRYYVIPTFQREIRWRPENLIELMNDIRHSSKFLGNIILTKNAEKEYAIIDGQQRTSLLLMLVQFVFANYADELPSPPELCFLKNQAFREYYAFQKNNFSFEGLDSEAKLRIESSDQYKQAEKLSELWATIGESGIINDSSEAREFVTNLYRCTFNVILSEDDSTNYSIEYFLDVNLKGIKLDTEDIFKGYLFHLDPSDEVREIWVDLKRASWEFNEACVSKRTKNECYPLMKMLEHFLYCCIYSEERHKEIVFGEDFCLKQKTTIGNTVHYAGEHVLKAVNNNKYIREILKKAIAFLRFASDVVVNEGPSKDFKDLFVIEDDGDRVDNCDIGNFYKIIKMILLDRNIMVSKAILIKYVINVLLNNSKNTKAEYKKLYSIHMYLTFFSIFENKKGIEPVAKILKSDEWTEEIECFLKAYSDKTTISGRKRGAEFRYSTNPTNEEQRYHSISLAAVYNYYNGQSFGVKRGKTADLHRFLVDSTTYSTEHFIINDSGKCRFKYCDSEGYYDYEYTAEIKKYAASIFNFIYLPEEENQKMKNMGLREKLDMLLGATVDCEYSKMVIEVAREAFVDFPKVYSGHDSGNKVALDKYYAYDFKEQYLRFVSLILIAVADRLCK